MMNFKVILNEKKDLIRANLNKFTQKAFQMIPGLNRPRILDIGCGSGIPTMELAKLSDGQIVAIDIDQFLLDRLSKKVKEAEISDRIEVINCSMFDLKFPNQYFDVIWAEGAIARIGFKRGLKVWRPYLKHNGFLAVHDEMGNKVKKINQISSCGYDLLGYFILSKKVWWSEYFSFLENIVNELQDNYLDDKGALLELKKEQNEIMMAKKNPNLCASIFFIMQKKNGL